MYFFYGVNSSLVLLTTHALYIYIFFVPSWWIYAQKLPSIHHNIARHKAATDCENKLDPLSHFNKISWVLIRVYYTDKKLTLYWAYKIFTNIKPLHLNYINFNHFTFGYNVFDRNIRILRNYYLALKWIWFFFFYRNHVRGCVCRKNIVSKYFCRPNQAWSFFFHFPLMCRFDIYNRRITSCTVCCIVFYYIFNFQTTFYPARIQQQLNI